MRRLLVLRSLVLLAALATAACSAVVAPTPTATLTVLPTAAPTRPPTVAPPTATPAADYAPGNVRPPTADLTIGSQSQTSAVGTYCWRDLDSAGTGVGLCVDMLGIMTPAEPLVVPSGPFTAAFALPLDLPPTTVALWIYPATGESSVYTDTATLGWQPFLDEQYPVSVAQTPTATLDLADGVYVIALFAQWQDIGDVMYGYLVQVGDPVPTAAPAAGDLPPACRPATEAETAFVDPAGRYCLLYPSTFRTGDLTAERANFYGPPLDASVEPVFAILTIETLGSDGGRSLAAVVDDYLASSFPVGTVAVDRQPSQWGGQPAEVLYGLPGRQPSRQAIVLHGGTVYHIVLLPYDVTAPPALPDVENVWAVVSQSFTFLAFP